MKTSKHYCIIFICGRCTLPLPLPPHPRLQKTFLCSRNVGELNYSQRVVQGVTATLQERNLSLHFQCDASLHCRLLSLLFLFNNLISSLDLIFLPQMSLQRFMPMNIHPLFKNLVPFSQGRCSSAAGSEVCLPLPVTVRWGKAPAPGWEGRFAALTSLLLEPPSLSTLAPSSVKGRRAWLPQQLLRTGMGAVVAE